MGVYFAEKVAEYAQNPKVKRPDLRGFRDIKAQMYLGDDPDLSRSCDVIDHVSIRLPVYDFL